jgi:Protein of unknown function (DUF4242)
MVYVVERYLPGLSRSDLLRGLSRLERAEETKQGSAVRYLGSTIVLEDEACFCAFEGPSEAAVAEANTRAGLSFDRIVPAVTVRPTKGDVQMTASASIPNTIQIKRGRLLGLLVAVAVVAAGVTWAIQAYAVDTGTENAARSQPTAEQAAAVRQFATGLGETASVQQKALADAQSTRTASSIMNLTPGDLAGGGLSGYSLPSGQGPTAAEVLAEMSPASRHYVTSIMRLTFRQLAAGAAGSP